MPLLDGPFPVFHSKPVLIDYAAGVRDPRVIDARIRGLVMRLEYAGVSEDELVIRILEQVTETAGGRHVAEVTSRTAEAIEISVTQR